MPMILKPVPPVQGALWVRDGFRLFGRYPLAFSVMFAAFLFVALLSALVPLVGALLMLGSLPLLSLGFMVAAESALNSGPVHPGHYITPLKADPGRRKSLLLLCALYGAATVLIMVVSDWVDGGTFEQLQKLMASSGKQAEIDAIMADPAFAWGLFVRFGLAALLGLVFWHAPALIHWGHQGVGQALFSSALAVWTSRGAFAVYGLVWTGIVLVFGAVTALLFGVLGTPNIAGLVALPAALIFSTVFYVTLLFTFNDSFGGTGQVLREA